MDQFEKQPPSWAMLWLRIIVHPEFLEEIEGDLLEKYQTDILKFGQKKSPKEIVR